MTSARTKAVMDRRLAYRTAFLGADGKLSPAGKVIMADLKRYCRWAGSITIVSPVSRQVDVPASFQAEGRREVMARILSHLHVDDADLVRLIEREFTDD